MTTTETIITTVCDHYGLTKGELVGPKTERRISGPRDAAILLIRELTNQSYPAIGHIFGKRDHTTIMAARKRAQDRVDYDDEFEALIDHLRQSVLNPPKYEFTPRYSRHGYPLDRFHTCRMAAE